MNRTYFAPVKYLEENPTFPPREEGNTFFVDEKFGFCWHEGKWNLLTVTDDEMYKQFFMSYISSGIVLDTFKLKEMLKRFRHSEDEVNTWVNSFKEYCFEDLQREFNKRHKITCDMVDWAILNIGDEEVKRFLQYVWDNTSPMWRQSHYYLRDKGYVQ